MTEESSMDTPQSDDIRRLEDGIERLRNDVEDLRVEIIRLRQVLEGTWPNVEEFEDDG